jgi:hypothetical protein
MREVDLPSGAKLQIDLAPFSDSHELLQSLTEDIKGVKIAGTDEIDYNMLKDLFCVALSSKRIQTSLDKCLKRAIYNGAAISKETWEPAEARQDYIPACYEVAKENIIPFVKGLSAELSPALEMILKSRESKSQTTHS